MKNGEKYKTAKECSNAFNGYCLRQDCNRCWDISPRAGWSCLLKWLDLEAEEEKLLPCPICGSPCHVHDNAVECNSGECAYVCWQKGLRAGQNVAAHNRVARVVMEAK